MFKLTKTLFLLLSGIFILQSCLKDTNTQTYTIYVPVYKSPAEVRANIKTAAPQPIVHPGKIFIRGNFIFLNEVDKGVHIIDNTNPNSPINKHFIPIPGNLDIAVKGNTLYVDLYRDLVAIDITNPVSVKVEKIIDKVFPTRIYKNGFFPDSTMVVVDWIKKDTTAQFFPGRRGIDYAFEVQNSGGINTTTTHPAGVGGSMARFTLMGNYLYTVTDRELNVFNIAQPNNPLYSNMVPVGWRIETIFPFKNNLFIGSQTGMFIFNTTDPALPSMVSQFSHLTSCDPVIADDDFAYVTLRTGTTCAGTINQLDILNIQNLQAPTLVKSYDLTNPHGLSKSGNTLFICDGSGGLKVFDATDKNNLQLLKTVTGINTYDIITLNNIAIVVATDGLYQYDISQPANLKLKSKIAY